MAGKQSPVSNRVGFTSSVIPCWVNIICSTISSRIYVRQLGFFTVHSDILLLIKTFPRWFSIRHLLGFLLKGFPWFQVWQEGGSAELAVNNLFCLSCSFWEVVFRWCCSWTPYAYQYCFFVVGAVGEMASMKRHKLWKTGEDGLCCSSSITQTWTGPSSLLEERSKTPIVSVVSLCCRLPPKLGETAKV